MPMSEAFHDRLSNVIVEAAERFGTPFHIYDETGIRETGQNLTDAFIKAEGFREFFAVKALPNPRILEIMKDMGFGFDCSSISELVLGRQAGGIAEDIFFSSNNTSQDEFECALSEGGSIVNLDSLDLIESLPAVPELVCFRYNPGPRRTGNAIIGVPEESKYGLRHDQMEAAYRRARALGASRFGMHTMLVSNELDYRYMVETTRMLLDLVEEIGGKMGVRFEFVNIGGGLGIPYRPGESALDIHALGREAGELLERFREKNGYAPKLFVESGRYMTGPHGVLVTRAINLKDTYRKYIGCGRLHVLADASRDLRRVPRDRRVRKENERRRHHRRCGGVAVRKQRQVRNPAPSSPNRPKRPADHPGHRRARPCHGIQLQRPPASQGTSSQDRRRRGTRPEGRVPARPFLHAEFHAGDHGPRRSGTWGEGRFREKRLIIPEDPSGPSNPSGLGREN